VLPSTAYVGVPAVGVDGEADGLVAWQRVVVEDAGRSLSAIEFVERRRGGAWTRARTLATGLRAATADRMAAAVNARGDAVVAWVPDSPTVELPILFTATRHGLTGRWILHATARLRGLAFGFYEDLPAGRATVVYVQTSGSGPTAQSILRIARTAVARPRWHLRPEVLRPPAFPSFALNRAGTVLVGWRDGPSLRSAQWAPSRGWEQPQDIASPGPGMFGPGLALSQAGRALAGWGVAGPPGQVATAARDGRGFPWQPDAALQPADGEGPALAINDRGDEVAAWLVGLGVVPGSSTVQAAVRRPGEAWGAPQVLLGNANSGESIPFVGAAALADDGRAFLILGTLGSLDYRRTVAAIRGPSDAGWSVQGLLDDDGPVARFGEDGSAVVAWGLGESGVVVSEYRPDR